MPLTLLTVLCCCFCFHFDFARAQNFVVRTLGSDTNEVINISTDVNGADVSEATEIRSEDALVCNITQQGGPAGPGLDCKLPFKFNGIVRVFLIVHKVKRVMT